MPKATFPDFSTARVKSDNFDMIVGKAATSESVIAVEPNYHANIPMDTIILKTIVHIRN